MVLGFRVLGFIRQLFARHLEVQGLGFRVWCSDLGSGREFLKPWLNLLLAPTSLSPSDEPSALFLFRTSYISQNSTRTANLAWAF